MLDDKDTEEQDAIDELQTFSISESIKMRRAKRKQEQQEFEEQLKVLQEKTDKLKKDLGYE